MSIPSETNGSGAIPHKQNIPNNQSSVAMGMPFKPAPMTQGNFFSMSRMAYNRNVNQNVDSVGKNQVPASKKWYGSSSSRSSSEHINMKTIEAAGKGTTNRINPELFSFSGPDQTTIKTALARCRGSGSVAPKKKGAI